MTVTAVKPMLALPGPTHYAQGPLPTRFQGVLDQVRSDLVAVRGIVTVPGWEDQLAVSASRLGAEAAPEAIAGRLRVLSQRLDQVFDHAHHGLLAGGMHPTLGIERAENLLFAQARTPEKIGQIGIIEVRINLTTANSIDDAFGDRYLNEVKLWLHNHFGSEPGVVTHGGLPTIFRVTTTKDEIEIAAIMANFRTDLVPRLVSAGRRFQPDATVGYVSLVAPRVDDTTSIADILGLPTTTDAERMLRTEKIQAWRQRVLAMIQQAHLQAAVLTAFAESLRREKKLSMADQSRYVFTAHEAEAYRAQNAALEARWADYAHRRPGYIPVGADVPYLRKGNIVRALGGPYQSEHIRFPRPLHDLGRARHLGGSMGGSNGGGYLDRLQQHLDKLVTRVERGGEQMLAESSHDVNNFLAAVDQCAHLVALSVWADRDARYPDAYAIGSRDAVEYAHTPFVAAVAADQCDHLAVVDVDGLRAFGQAYPPQQRDDDYFWLLDVMRKACTERGVAPPILGIRGDTMAIGFHAQTLDGAVLQPDMILDHVQRRVREHFADKPFQDWKKCDDGTRRPLWCDPRTSQAEPVACWPDQVPDGYVPYLRTLTLTVAYGAMHPLTTREDITHFWDSFLTLSNHNKVLKKRHGVRKGGLGCVISGAVMHRS